MRLDDVTTEKQYPLCAWHFPHYKGSLCGSQGILKWLCEKCCIKSNFWDEGLNGFHHWRRNDRNLNYDLAIWENKKLPFWVRLMALLPISRQGKGGQSRTLGSHINICDLLKNVDGSDMNLYFADNTKDPWHFRNRLGKIEKVLTTNKKDPSDLSRVQFPGRGRARGNCSINK